MKLYDQLPLVSFEMSDAQSHTFAEFLGKTVVLYFYPKDDTPGCTLEAQGFRDKIETFTAKNAIILGVSKDSVKKHQKFREKHCLPFELIVDTDQSGLCEWFGVWKEKSMYGKKYWGIERSTFIVSPEGRVVKEWRKVSVAGHVDEVLESIK